MFFDWFVFYGSKSGFDGFIVDVDWVLGDGIGYYVIYDCLFLGFV